MGEITPHYQCLVGISFISIVTVIYLRLFNKANPRFVSFYFLKRVFNLCCFKPNCLTKLAKLFAYVYTQIDMYIYTHMYMCYMYMNE
jgi:hypothetical protein